MWAPSVGAGAHTSVDMITSELSTLHVRLRIHVCRHGHAVVAL